MHKCGDRVVATCGLAQCATGGVGGACPEIQTGRRHRAQVHRVGRSPGASAPSQRTVWAPTQLHEAPHPCAIHLCAIKFQQSRVSPPRSPHSRAPEAAPDGRPCRMPERWRGQILHDVLGPTEHVAPEELSLSQGFVMLTKQGLCRVRRKGGDEARKGWVHRGARRTRP